MLDIVHLVLLILFSSRISRRARTKGYNPTPWVIRTVLFYILGLFLAAVILSTIIAIKNPALMQVTDLDQMMQYLSKEGMFSLLLYQAFGIAGGVGGFLYVRYRLDKRPPASKQQQ